jgi:hypothetical protein
MCSPQVPRTRLSRSRCRRLRWRCSLVLQFNNLIDLPLCPAYSSTLVETDEQTIIFELECVDLTPTSAAASDISVWSETYRSKLNSIGPSANHPCIKLQLSEEILSCLSQLRISWMIYMSVFMFHLWASSCRTWESLCIIISCFSNPSSTVQGFKDPYG